MSKEHKAHALRIKCIDWRFSEVIERDSLARGLNGRSDDISWPGASSDFDNVSQAAALSIELHDPDEAYIYEHEDCGAYGNDNSEETHKENAEKLKEFLLGKKPQIKVTTLIATLGGIKTL